MIYEVRFDNGRECFGENINRVIAIVDSIENGKKVIQDSVEQLNYYLDRKLIETTLDDQSENCYCYATDENYPQIYTFWINEVKMNESDFSADVDN